MNENHKKIEGYVIASIIINNEKYYEVSGFLKPEHFYFPHEREIYKTIIELMEKEKKFDIVVLTDEVKNVKASDIAEILNIDPDKRYVREYGEIVLNQYTERKIIESSSKIKELGLNGDTGKASDEMYDLIERLDNLKKGIETDSDDIKELLERSIEKREKTPYGKLLGFKSGLKTLDRATSGIQKGHLYIIGGKSSFGKSMVAVSVLSSCLKDGAKAIYFSLEMSELQITNRFLANASEVPIDYFGTDRIHKDNEFAYDIVNKYKLRITCKYNYYQDIIKYAKAMKKKGLCDVIVIDYLQNMTIGKHKDQYTMLQEASDALQWLALDSGIAVIGLSQMNEQNQFKGARDILESADVGIRLERGFDNEIANNELKMLLTKNRHGRTGLIDCIIKPEICSIKEIIKNYE